jgi:hypothetical protein
VLRSWDEVELKKRLLSIVRTEIKRDASPGAPFAAIAATNEELISKHSLMLVNCAYERLLLLASDADLSHATAVDLVENGFCDPVRIFVKQEPHTRKKMKQRRYRLISSVSVVDQIVERLLFGAQNRFEISLWSEIPSKPGMGLALRDQAQKLFSDLKMKSSRAKAACADISGFDWSVQEWEFEAELYMRLKLMEPSLKDNPRLLNAVRNRFACFSLSLFQLSDGTLIAQELPGIMKSGSYLTSSMNSRIRCLMAEIIGAEWCIAMGDDSVEAFVENAPAKYLALGHTCKEYELCPTDFEGILDSVEFCSHKIEAEGSFLVPWAKTLYRYLSSKTPQFHDIEFELGTNPHWPSIRQYLESVQLAPSTKPF